MGIRRQPFDERIRIEFFWQHFIFVLLLLFLFLLVLLVRGNGHDRSIVVRRWVRGRQGGTGGENGVGVGLGRGGGGSGGSNGNGGVFVDFFHVHVRTL